MGSTDRLPEERYPWSVVGSVVRAICCPQYVWRFVAVPGNYTPAVEPKTIIWVQRNKIVKDLDIFLSLLLWPLVCSVPNWMDFFSLYLKIGGAVSSRNLPLSDFRREVACFP